MWTKLIKGKSNSLLLSTSRRAWLPPPPICRRECTAHSKVIISLLVIFSTGRCCLKRGQEMRRLIFQTWAAIWFSLMLMVNWHASVARHTQFYYIREWLRAELNHARVALNCFHGEKKAEIQMREKSLNCNSLALVLTTLTSSKSSPKSLLHAIHTEYIQKSVQRQLILKHVL